MDEGGLRVRNTSQQASSTEEAKQVVLELNDEEDHPEKDMKDKRTFGRTPGGTVFTVPETHDMVSQLLSPNQPKNLSDIAVLVVLGLHGVMLYLIPSFLRMPIFAVVFVFWRGCYNMGIGYLLYIQSTDRRLVAWAKKCRLFVNPGIGENPHPMLYYFLKGEMETKIPNDYRFEEAPIEYNTWLVFRRIVDLILMCDFVSYCLFAIACGGTPVGEKVFITAFRWIVGWTLVGFNLWVKLDAHRVVKDYAWYWGDFFYLIDQELTFDGVFEMAPHPMYSIGYAGYYGISLMAASYSVFFVSIVAHASQFAFLVWVEKPHIEKTYNVPPSRSRESIIEPEDCQAAESNYMNGAPPLASTSQPSPVHNLLGLQNIDLYRTTDTSVILLQLYILALTSLTPSTPLFQALFVINAAIWRVWYSLGIGYLLNRQSMRKKWTRHFVKYGESTEEAWRQWKGTYHLSMTMCYASFIAASWKAYSPPGDWSHGLPVHLVGAGLIFLQIWTAVSIYESLGEFGWFFGDFFFDQAPKLTYSGIYRFLNNPERVMGLAGVWGAALITGSSSIFFLALLSHILSLCFIQFVERPHMQKLYGQSLRRESGLVRSLRRSLPPPLRQWHGSVDKMLSETVDFVEDFVDAARPRLAAGVSTFVRDSTALFTHPTRISITRLEPDLAGYDLKDYSLTIDGTPSDTKSTSEKQSTKHDAIAETSAGSKTSVFKPLRFEYGAPIRVQWSAPLHHSTKDWIGLYRVADNASREATRVASQGRWTATNRDQYDSAIADRGNLVSDKRRSGVARKDGETKDYVIGEMEFSGDKLWFAAGFYEFRYHHNGKHNVMAVSLPFEIGISKFDEDDIEADSNGSIRGAIEEALLPMVRNCLDRNPEIAPNTALEAFGSRVERESKYAKRVVYAVQQMFGIELAPSVVQADGNVKNLAWRVSNAKMVLAPYSMSPCRGTSTPNGEKY